METCLYETSTFHIYRQCILNGLYCRCNQYLPELQYKAKSKCEVELYFLQVIVQYVCCILLLCWYTCNQSYIEQFFNLHISTLHPSAISSISFKNQVNMKYMQSVFPLLPFHSKYWLHTLKNNNNNNNK
jgi:hypothetical protein